MIKRANAAGNGPGEIEIMVIEKSRELGAHNLSGAVMDPRSIKELVPDWKERDFPVERTVEEEEFTI